MELGPSGIEDDLPNTDGRAKEQVMKNIIKAANRIVLFMLEVELNVDFLSPVLENSGSFTPQLNGLAYSQQQCQSVWLLKSVLKL